MPTAPHELVSGIAGELMIRVMTQGYSGFLLLALHAFYKEDSKGRHDYSPEDIAKWVGASPQAVKTASWIALRKIQHYEPKPISIQTRMMFTGLLLAKRLDLIDIPLR